MADETVNYGFTRVGEGEDLSKNGYAALDTDRVMLDDLIEALVNHNHDASPRLGNPVGSPTIVTTTTGGVIPANTTLYYTITYLDRWGLETAGSTEVSVTTPLGLDAPTAPAVSAENTSGTLASGQYAYSLSVVDAAGGESTASPFTQVQVTSTGTSRVRLLLPPLPPTADHYRLYRAKPGQVAQYLLADNITTTTIYDDGSVAEDTTITTPELNTTGNNCCATITVPTGVLPDAVFSWKIYRALTPGGYDLYNLVHHVVEPTTSLSGDVRVSWVDDGTELNLGVPKITSATMSGGRIVQLSGVAGQLPLSVLPRGSRSISTRVAALANGVDFYKTRYPRTVQPSAITAWFQTPPSGLSGGATPPAQIRIRLLDAAATPTPYELVCADNSGYYVVEFPLTMGGTFEAEAGPRAGVTDTPIVNDDTASNGQAVEINAQNEFVLVDLGTLDPGTYIPTVVLKETDPGYGHPNNDLRLRVVTLDTDGQTILGDIDITNFDNSGYDDTAYSTLTGGNFTLMTATRVGLAVKKLLTSAATYWVDRYTYSVVLPTLSAGDLTLTTSVDGTPTSMGGDVAVTVWF